MKRWHTASVKLLIMMLMVSLMVTGCSLLPTTVADSIQNAQEGGDGSTVTISKEEYDRLQKYAEMDELVQVVEAYYYQEPNVDAMIENAERGLLYGLEDPYTYYYSPEEYAALWESDEGQYAGIGIQLTGSMETYLCTIMRVFTGSPAEAAGLLKGDTLVKVEDLEVTTYSMQEAVDIMRGQVGDKVKVQVKRGNELLDFEIPRAVIHVNWVSSLMLDNDIGYIVLYEFSGDCAPAFQKQLDELMAKGAKGLIIDLRDNPGGWVDDAVQLADIFLPEGTVAYLEKRDGSREYYTAKAGEINIPLVVLINENSASASEILSGALQDYHKATLVGTKSFGKGVVQYVLPVGTKGAGMQLTIAQYFTPNGNVVHKTGITPDVEMPMPEGQSSITFDLGDLSDAQLQKAYEVAQQLVAEKAK